MRKAFPLILALLAVVRASASDDPIRQFRDLALGFALILQNLGAKILIKLDDLQFGFADLGASSRHVDGRPGRELVLLRITDGALGLEVACRARDGPVRCREQQVFQTVDRIWWPVERKLVLIPQNFDESTIPNCGKFSAF